LDSLAKQPIIVLVIIAIPSFRLLKMAEHAPPADMTIKAVGSQWYWSYSYPDHGNFSFDSYMIQEADFMCLRTCLFYVLTHMFVPVVVVAKQLQLQAQESLVSYVFLKLTTGLWYLKGRQ